MNFFQKKIRKKVKKDRRKGGFLSKRVLLCVLGKTKKPAIVVIARLSRDADGGTRTLPQLFLMHKMLLHMRKIKALGLAFYAYT